LRAVRHTTAAPLRCADRTLASAAGALLPPRLRATAAHFRTRLGAVRAGASRGQLRVDDLVHDCDVRLDAEDRLRQLHGGARFAVGLLHHQGTHAFTAFRTKTKPPVGPGTAPLTNRRLRSASPSTTSRFSVVTRSAPYWPAMRTPLKTRA